MGYQCGFKFLYVECLFFQGMLWFHIQYLNINVVYEGTANYSMILNLLFI